MENVLKKMRVDRGLKKAHLAERLGMTRQAYHRIEGKWPYVSLRSIFKVATELEYQVKIGVVETSSNHLES